MLGFIVKTSLPLTLPGCLPEFDALARHFVKSDDNVRNKVLKESEKLLQSCCKNQVKKLKMAKKYVKLMKSSMTYDGKIKGYFKNEENRLNRILNNNVSQKNKDGVSRTINVIKSFKTAYFTANNLRDEI